jgi:hypothetical protein
VLGAALLGVADHGQRTGGEQAGQIVITSLADIAELFLALARVPLGRQPDLGREISPRPESPWISNAGDQGGGQRGADVWNLVELLARLSSASLSGQLDFSMPI